MSKAHMPLSRVPQQMSKEINAYADGADYHSAKTNTCIVFFRACDNSVREFFKYASGSISYAKLYACTGYF